jgi:hypothetical protein
VKNQKIALWGFMFAALCEALAGLRDIFAPGFFTMSGRHMDGGDIALQFAIAAMCFVVGVSFSQRNQDKQHAKKNLS